MRWEDAALLIITEDGNLAETLGGKLREWGSVVHSCEPDYVPAVAPDAIDVILVDVRRQAEKVLNGLGSILGNMPLAEAILINSSGNIRASMAGMQAGASDELTVPCDTENLRKVVSAACSRSKKRRKRGRSLLAIFEEAMSAATFAQAGEFATAIELMNGSAPPETEEKPDAATRHLKHDEEKQ